jgi:glycosyltransferase involved in cell wall biosynthesis
VRILHISSAKQFGPTECHIAEVCRGLQENGHDVFVALRPTNEWQDKLSFLPEGDVFHVSVRNPFGVLSAKKIAAFVKKNGIDIIHAHLPRDYFPASLACSMAKNARFVLSRHSPQPLKPFNRFALKNLAAAVTSSGSIERSLHTIFPRRKIRPMSAGIDGNAFKELNKEELRKEFREFHRIPGNNVLIAMIGDLCEAAGQRDFVLAANEIAKKKPDTYFAIVGYDHTTTQGYKREISRLIEVLGLSSKFLWLDHAGDSLGMFSATDVLLPAMNWEFPGREILEAISLGALVLQFSADGNSPFGNISEVLISSPEALAAADAVCRFLDDGDLRSRTLEKLEHLISNEHSIARTIADLEKIYASLE